MVSVHTFEGTIRVLELEVMGVHDVILEILDKAQSDDGLAVSPRAFAK